ncbi:IPT/TIG domain-containing protein, partial [Aduncisulcus paluster]
EAIENAGSVIYVNYGDMKLQFLPVNLNTGTFREMNFYYPTYGRITANWENSDYSSMLKGYIPRGQRAASNVFKIKFSAVNNQAENEFNTTSGDMDVVLPYDPYMLRGSGEETLKLYKYDIGAKQWVEYPGSVNTQTDEVHARIHESGYYILMADR